VFESCSYKVRATPHRINGKTTMKKLLSAAAILSTLSATMVTPVFAQQATQEPGEQAFYRSLGVGSQSAAPTPTRDTYAMVQPQPVARPHLKHHRN
jgi:hypothetical protein